MADWVVPVLVAVIGGPVVVLIQQFRKESSEQHGVLAGKIDKIADKRLPMFQSCRNREMLQ